MGTIPAPNIFQDAQEISATPQNALAEYARVEQLKQQTAGLAQEQQERGLQMEMQRRQLADQDALTKTIASYDPTVHTLADIPKLVTQNGGSGKAALEAQAGLIQQRQNYLKMSDDQFAQEQRKADLIEGVHDQVTQAPPEQKQTVYQAGLQQLAQAGVDVSKEPIQYPGDDAFAQHLAPIRLHSAILAEAEKDRETTAKEQTAQADLMKAKQGQWEKFPELGILVNTATGEQKSVTGSGGLMPPGMLEAKYVALQQKKNAGQPLSPEDAAFTKGYEKFKTLVPVANFNLQNAGAAADVNGNPSAIAQAIADNRMKWSEAVSPRTPQATKNAIMAQVYKLNPNYDTSEFGLEQDAAKKARSGAWADTRVAYNTAIDHSKQLLDAVDAMNSGDVKKLNSLKNFFKTEFGSPDVPSYSAIANAYNHEVTSVVSKNHITDAEVAAGGSVLPSDASPQQLRSVVANYNKLMASKRDELDKVIKAGAGSKANSVLDVKSGSEAGHSFTLNGQRYENVPDALYQKYKNQAGFTE